MNSEKGTTMPDETTGFPLETGQPTPHQQESGVSRWRKRPVTVEARRVQTHNLAEMGEWCGGVAYTEDTPWDYSAGAVVMPDGHYAHVGHRDWGVIVPTLEGDMLARYGWWIIKGVRGEFYPCDPEIFAETYEPAEAGDGMVLVSREDLRMILDVAPRYASQDTFPVLREAHDRLSAAAEVTR